MAEQDSKRDEGCSRCGRRSDSVTVEELGDWIVDVDSAVVCSECATESQTSRLTERRVSRRTA
jgi:hypothetical protein